VHETPVREALDGRCNPDVPAQALGTAAHDRREFRERDSSFVGFLTSDAEPSAARTSVSAETPSTREHTPHAGITTLTKTHMLVVGLGRVALAEPSQHS
jgi:hypothetical protein